MDNGHIIIPKDQMPSLPSNFKVTKLGWPKKSIRQYRYGRLHIREYNDRFEAHVDKIDPKIDPLGHVVHDAPEVLAMIGSGVTTAIVTGAVTYKKTGSKLFSIVASISTGLAVAYVAKNICDKQKEM
ncbi:MAG: putative membrane protein [Cenarchaeum symbiont of Oopsacas minuta]|nr:putative membrane protein [Cenarchaeum symbiont of Oopsacas minuta]